MSGRCYARKPTGNRVLQLPTTPRGCGDIRLAFKSPPRPGSIELSASGPGGNAKVERTWQDALDVEEDGATFKMETDRLITVDMDHGGAVFTGPLDDFGDAPANDAHGFAEATLNMMRDSNDKPLTIDSTENLPRAIEEWTRDYDDFKDDISLILPLAITRTGTEFRMPEEMQDLVPGVYESYLKREAKKALPAAEDQGDN